MSDSSRPPGEPIFINYTGRSATIGEHPVVPTFERKPSALRRAIGAIGNLFMSLLPDKGGKASTTDQSLQIKTSPSIWEYEMFRQEWDRRTVLRELERLLDEDPRVARANRTFAATAVRRGMTVTVTSQVSDKLAAQAQDTINQLIRDCQLNSKLASWCRIVVRDGDLFLNPVVDVATKRIKNIKRLPGISMQRNEDITGDFPDLNAAFRQIDPVNLQIIDDYPLWAVNHIRWNHEEGERYGTSQYLQIRGYWKKLNMTEEDIVVRRRSRATPRRLHTVGSKEHPGTEADITSYRTRNNIMARTANAITDFFGNGLTDIKDLDGDPHLDHIKDVEHLQEVYMIGTGVPLHMLGFGKNVNRDIVEDQVKQFKEDCQELRDLLEYGDSSPYSGLRFIFDFALWLQGIDPAMVDYNVAWYAEDNETASDRVDRVIKMRASQPKPLVSQKTAVQILAKDLNLENDTAIDAELAEIEGELAQDREDQATLTTALNPEKPATRPESTKTATSLTDSVSKKKLSLRLRGKLITRLEAQVARQWRARYAAALKSAASKLKRLQAKHDFLTTDEHRQSLIGETMEILVASLRETAESGKGGVMRLYRQAAAHGGRAAHLDVRGTVLPMTDDAEKAPKTTVETYVNPETARYLQQEAGTRIRRIDETTLQAVRKELSEAYSNSEEFPSWIDRIESVMDCEVPTSRAETIARTELSWAYNTGAIGEYAELGIERVERLEVMDNRTCPGCGENHERIYTLREADGVLPAHPRCRGCWIAADMRRQDAPRPPAGFGGKEDLGVTKTPKQAEKLTKEVARQKEEGDQRKKTTEVGLRFFGKSAIPDNAPVLDATTTKQIEKVSRKYPKLLAALRKELKTILGTKFDPSVLPDFDSQDVEFISKVVLAVPNENADHAWRLIRRGDVIGLSVLVHEIVEANEFEKRHVDLFDFSEEMVRRRTTWYPTVHPIGLIAEHKLLFAVARARGYTIKEVGSLIRYSSVVSESSAKIDLHGASQADGSLWFDPADKAEVETFFKNGGKRREIPSSRDQSEQ